MGPPKGLACEPSSEALTLRTSNAQQPIWVLLEPFHFSAALPYDSAASPPAASDADSEGDAIGGGTVNNAGISQQFSEFLQDQED